MDLFSNQQLYTCQVGKVQKREISLFASCQRGRFYAKPFRDINFIYQHQSSGWNFANDEIILPYKGLKLFIWCIRFYLCTWWILWKLSNAILLQNSIQFILFQCSKLRLKRSHMRLKLWFCDLNLRKVAELRTKFKTTIESVFVWSGEFNLFYTDSFSGVNIMSYVKAQEFRINVNNSW